MTCAGTTNKRSEFLDNFHTIEFTRKPSRQFLRLRFPVKTVNFARATRPDSEIPFRRMCAVDYIQYVHILLACFKRVEPRARFRSPPRNSVRSWHGGAGEKL